MATTNAQKKVYLYADWIGLEGPQLMGVLNASSIKGKEIFSFEYDPEWLQTKFQHLIDPDLQFFGGQQYLSDQKRNFGIFLDSSPDRWGETLMLRREAVIARIEKRPVKTLMPSDFLLGVYDGHRMGGIRFKLDQFGPFLNDNREMASPTWTSIRELENASKRYEEDNVDDPDYLKWVNVLIAPGSSLGGARPKASVVDPDKQLWIAKFPSVKDDTNKGAWEMVVNELAKSAGINVAEGMAQKFNNDYHTFLTKRFDRTPSGGRVHFASAMTLLGHTDGEPGASYLEMVEFLIKNGAQTNKDLEELWRRIVFNICVKNTDDHLRNHGFLLRDKGWILSPAYDINPVATGAGLSLNISDTDNSLDLDLALEVAEYFYLKEEQANDIIRTVKNAVANWQTIANKYGISRSEQERMANAFLIPAI